MDDYSGMITDLVCALKQASLEAEKFEDGIKTSARKTRSMLLSVEKKSKLIRQSMLAQRKKMGKKIPKKEQKSWTIPRMYE